jgi:hypothetical protein
MTEDRALFDKIYQHSESGILDFFASANAALVKRKLEKYGLEDSVTLHVSDNKMRSPLLAGRLFDLQRPDALKNQFRRKLRGGCFGLRKSEF